MAETLGARGQWDLFRQEIRQVNAAGVAQRDAMLCRFEQRQFTANRRAGSRDQQTAWLYPLG